MSKSKWKEEFDKKWSNGDFGLKKGISPEEDIMVAIWGENTLNDEILVKFIEKVEADTRRELIKEIEELNSAGFKRDETYKEYNIDLQNNKQESAFRSGWAKKTRDIFDYINQLKKKYGVEE